MSPVCARPSCARSTPMLDNDPSCRYCSVACRRLAKVELHDENTYQRTPSPFYLPDSLRPRRPCGHCHRYFVASTRTQEFCHVGCADAAQNSESHVA